MSSTIVKRRGLSRVPKRIVPRSTPLRLTEADFVDWIVSVPDVGAEWAAGQVEIMPPVSSDHSDINGFLISLLREYVEAKRLGRVLGPEFMVRLDSGCPSRRVPDVLFVSKSRVELIRKVHLQGPPDVSFEIVSADDPGRDIRVKYLEYQAAGVKEYWIVDPINRNIVAHRLSESGRYDQIEPGRNARLESTVIRGFFMRKAWLFGARRKTVRFCLDELGIR